MFYSIYFFIAVKNNAYNAYNILQEVIRISAA